MNDKPPVGDLFQGPEGATRVLVVDDEDTIREVMRLALGEEFAVALARDAEAALAILQQHPADVVLLDKNLPSMPGLELLREIRRRWPATEVIIITAYASLESAVEALRLGACDYLIKPFPHISVVEEKVRWARDRHKLIGERLELVNQLLRVNEELRQAMENLRLSEERYRALFNGASDMVFVNIVNRDRLLGRFTDVNDAACETLGYTRDELLKLSLKRVLPTREHVALPGMMSLLYAEKRVLFETEVITKAGRGVAVEVHSHLFGFHGQDMVLSIARNTSDHVLVEVERPS